MLPSPFVLVFAMISRFFFFFFATQKAIATTLPPPSILVLLQQRRARQSYRYLLFWFCCSKFFLFFFATWKVMATFCFGLVVANQAMAELSSPFMLQQAFFSFFITTQKAMATRLSSPSILVLLQQRRQRQSCHCFLCCSKPSIFFCYSAKGDNNNTSDVAVVAITFYFGLAMNMIWNIPNNELAATNAPVGRFVHWMDCVFSFSTKCNSS